MYSTTAISDYYFETFRVSGWAGSRVLPAWPAPGPEVTRPGDPSGLGWPVLFPRTYITVINGGDDNTHSLKYSRTPLNPYLLADSPNYGLSEVMGYKRCTKNRFEIFRKKK